MSEDLDAKAARMAWRPPSKQSRVKDPDMYEQKMKVIVIFSLRDTEGRGGKVRVVAKSPDPTALVEKWWSKSRDRRAAVTSGSAQMWVNPVVGWMASYEDGAEGEVCDWEEVETDSGVEIEDTYGGGRARLELMKARLRATAEGAELLPSSTGGARPGAGRPNWKEASLRKSEEWR